MSGYKSGFAWMLRVWEVQHQLVEAVVRPARAATRHFWQASVTQQTERGRRGDSCLRRGPLHVHLHALDLMRVFALEPSPMPRSTSQGLRWPRLRRVRSLPVSSSASLSLSASFPLSSPPMLEGTISSRGRWLIQPSTHAHDMQLTPTTRRTQPVGAARDAEATVGDGDTGRR